MLSSWVSRRSVWALRAPSSINTKRLRLGQSHLVRYSKVIERKHTHTDKRRAGCSTWAIKMFDNSCRVSTVKVRSQHINWTLVRELQCERPHWNTCGERTNRALTVLVSLQPINAKHNRDADTCDQWARRVTGSTCQVQFSSRAVNKSVSCE